MKIHCDLSRICEVEDSVVEWYQTEFFQRQEETLDRDLIAQLAANFEITNNQVAGVDGMIYKLQLIAKKPGYVTNQLIGMPILIKPK